MAADEFDDPDAAAERAEELGLDGIHYHDTDEGRIWMPGGDHEQYEEAVAEVEAEMDAEDIQPGDTFSDELNDDVVTVIDRDGDILSVTTDEGMGWDEHADTLADKIDRGTMTPMGMESEAFAGYEDFDACVRDNSDKDDPDAYCASIMRQVEGKADTTDATPVDQKGEFSEGEAVRWSWQGNPVHGRIAEERPQQATPEDTDETITGDDDEPVYLIDEFDDRVGAYRRENVAKPESSLNESRKDLPPRTESNYVDAEAWESLTTALTDSRFTARELDHIHRELGADALIHDRPAEWLVPHEEPAVFEADIPDKYLDGRSEEMFIPNAGMADAARKVKDWRDEHGAENVAGGASDGEGTRRASQIIEHHDRDEPLAIEYWEEIANYHNRHRAQGSHELDSEHEGEPWTDAGYVSNLNWGGDPGYEQAQRVMDVVDEVDQEAAVEMRGPVGATRSVNPETVVEEDTNKIDVGALDGELRDAVEADDFYVYGKASIEQWDDDDPPTYIQMDALESALDRYFGSETAPGIISRHHQDIPVGVPVESFEFSEDTALEIGDETYQFEAGDTARTHVSDSDGDGRPELWLAANISNDTEMGKKTRIRAMQGDLDGFSVTVHRNDDELTDEGRIVTEADLHAVTIGTDQQIKNPGSEFDVAEHKSVVGRVRDRVAGLLRG